MSRTRKSKKSPSKEYWGKRPGNSHGAVPGPVTKQTTHARERAMGKQELLNTPHEPEYDSREWTPTEVEELIRDIEEGHYAETIE